jgi:hypothetical protein
MEKRRGFLTEEFKQEANKYLGRELTITELRLYPYLCLCAVDWQRVERSKTTPEEQEIMKMLEKEKRLVREYPSYMHPTKEFYMFMQKALMECYVITAEDYKGGE